MSKLFKKLSNGVDLSNWGLKTGSKGLFLAFLGFFPKTAIKSPPRFVFIVGRLKVVGQQYC
jgi:hypothetical protein